MDDLIVSANAAKFNPLSLQIVIGQHLAATFAFVTGNHRLRPVLIVQLQDPSISKEETEKVRADIWLIVSKWNEKSPSQGRILVSLFMFTKPEKPFPLAGKDNLRRALAEQIYEEELNALHEAVEPEA